MSPNQIKTELMYVLMEIKYKQIDRQTIKTIDSKSIKICHDTCVETMRFNLKPPSSLALFRHTPRKRLVKYTYSYTYNIVTLLKILTNNRLKLFNKCQHCVVGRVVMAADVGHCSPTLTYSLAAGVSMHELGFQQLNKHLHLSNKPQTGLSQNRVNKTHFVKHLVFFKF